MPVWAMIAIGVGGLLLVAAAAALTWLAWRSYERRVLLRLVVRAEAIEAAAQALSDVLARLAQADDAELGLFATDPDSGERRALYEVRRRAEILRDEFDHMPVPRSLVHVAESLGDAAFVIAREASAVRETDIGAEALDRIASVNLQDVRGYTAQARVLVTDTCEEWGVEQMNVYGGGLYL